MMGKIKQDILLAIGLCFLLMPFAVMAEKYGPTKASDSLWRIAKTIPTNDKSIKTIQIVYAIYKLNPNAFNSGNMNELKKGVYLQLPESMAIVTQLSYKEAKKKYQTHLQQLDLLQISAKDLAKAKSRYARWKRKFRKLKAKASLTTTLSYEEKLALSAQLKRAARKQSKWKKEVKKLRRLLLEKVALEKTQEHQSSSEVVQVPLAKQQKPSVTTPEKETSLSDSSTAPAGKKLTRLTTDNTGLKLRLKNVEDKMGAMLLSQKEAVQSHNQKITQLQKELEKSKQFLQDKLHTQTKMEDRLAVLEGELGEKEQIIQKLRSTLATAADTMMLQQLESESLQKRLKELDVAPVIATNKKRLELTTTPITQAIIRDKAATLFKVAELPSEIPEQQGISSEAKALQLLFTLSTLSLLLLLLFFYLRKANRQRKFRKRMEVVELRLKPVDNIKKRVDSPFKRSA